MMKRLTMAVLPVLFALTALAVSTEARPYGTKHGDVWLGASVQAINPDLAEAFDLPVSYGVVINEVVPDSPADKAGLKPDDVIIAYNGDKVTDDNELRDMIAEARDGDRVTLTIVRDSKEQKLEVALEQRDDTMRWYSSDEDNENGNHSRGHAYEFKAEREKRPYIGVQLMSLSEQLAAYFGVNKDEGVLITEVEADSPAEKAGLKAGDVIVEVDGRTIDDAADLQRTVRRADPGDKLELGIVRDRRNKTVTVKVGETDEPGYRFFGFDGKSMPDIDFEMPNMPRMRGMFRADDHNTWRDREELQEDRNELREELRDLREQMKELRRELQDLKRSLK